MAKKMKGIAAARKRAAVAKKTGGGARKAGAARNPWAGLKPGGTNFTPLSPISLLPRAAEIYPDRVAVIHSAKSYTYAQYLARSRRLASALARRGVKKGEVVSAMLPNVPAMLDAHYGVPMLGAVLNAINTRLRRRVHRYDERRARRSPWRCAALPRWRAAAAGSRHRRRRRGDVPVRRRAKLAANGEAPQFGGQVLASLYQGDHTRLELDIGAGRPIVARIELRRDFAPGERLSFTLAVPAIRAPQP